MRHPNLLTTGNSVLIVVDVQDAFLKGIYEPQRVIDNTVRLIEAAKIFDVPILAATQYAEKLGGLNSSIAEALGAIQPINKTSFSCISGKNFPEMIAETKRTQILLCGVEAHICVNQTAHDLLQTGYNVQIAKDAVSSRTPENFDIGINKMRDSGCVISSVETIIFEWLQDASNKEFKQILPLVK